MRNFETTTDYSQFNLLIENRSTSRNHINALKQAIKHNPEILKVQPILVNEEFEIIDGQHRFQAAVELGLPIAYVTVPGIGIETARAMNVLQRKWTPEDFARSYAKAGKAEYQTYIKIREDYPDFLHGTVLVYLTGYHQHGVTSKFRKGEMEINDEWEARKNLDRLTEIKQHLTVPLSNPLAYALLAAFNHEDFDYDRWLRKFKEHPELIKRSTSSRDYLRMIEDVLNFQSKSPTRLY